MPYLALKLEFREQSIAAEGLLDTGAAVNVLPYGIGQRLGANWEAQNSVIRLGGNLRDLEARPLILRATIGPLAPVKMAFAWAQAEDIPVILGQINFFLEFDADS
jgi:hypothetical protein